MLQEIVTNYDDVNASKLIATYTVNFSGKEGLYNAFINSKSYKENKDKWSIGNENKYILTYKFEGENK